MAAPWYVYVIALMVALPIFFLLGVGAVGLIKALFSWVLGPDTAPPAKHRGTAKGAGM